MHKQLMKNSKVNNAPSWMKNSKMNNAQTINEKQQSEPYTKMNIFFLRRKIHGRATELYSVLSKGIYFCCCYRYMRIKHLCNW